MKDIIRKLDNLETKGQLDEAVALIENIKSEYSNFPVFWWRRGNIYLKLENTNQALESFFRVLILDPANQESLDQFKLLSFYQHQKKKTETFLTDKINKKNQKKANLARHLLVIYYYINNCSDKIIETFKTINSIIPELQDIKYYSGAALLQLGNYEEAEKVFTGYAETGVSTIEIHLLTTLFKQKKYNECINKLISLLDRKSDSVSLRKFIKLYFINNPVEYEDFFEFVKIRIETGNDNLKIKAYLNFLAGILSKNTGNCSKAEEYFKKSLKNYNINQVQKELNEFIDFDKIKKKLNLLKKEYPGNKQIISENLYWLGIRSRKNVLTPPNEVEIEITNRCNNNCSACVYRSPMLGIFRKSYQWAEAELPFPIIKEAIMTLDRMGTKSVRFSGGGEPTIHPDFISVIKLLNETKLKCSQIITNGTLLNDEIIDVLTDGKIEIINISLWCGDAENYVKTHSNRIEKDFFNIIDSIKKIKKYRLKKCLKNIKLKPVIRVSTVIHKNNYHEIIKIYNLSKQLGVDEVLYSYFIPYFGVTDYLLLDKKKIEYVISQLESLKRIEKSNLKKIGYLKKMFPKNNRYIRYIFSLLKKYLYGPYPIFEDYLKLLKSDFSEQGKYFSANQYNFPCYMGWDTARITPQGYVSPCTSGLRRPVGNIFLSDFEKIWYSKEHLYFCNKAASVLDKKNDPYFEKIGCWRACDDFHSRYRIYLDNDKLPAYITEELEKALIFLNNPDIL